MAIAFRAASEGTDDQAGNVTLSKPTGVVDGDFLYAIITHNGDTGLPTITPPSGWTLDQSVDNGGFKKVSTFWKIASSEPSAWVWVITNYADNGASVCIALSGVATTSPIDVSGTQAESRPGGTTPWTYIAPDVITVTNNAWLINIVAMEAGYADDSTNYLPTGNTARYYTNYGVRYAVFVSTRSFPTAGSTGTDTFDSIVTRGYYYSFKIAVKPYTAAANTGNFFQLF